MRLRRALKWCIKDFPRLKERQGQRSGTLSGGEQQMLGHGTGSYEQTKDYSDG